MDKFDESNAGVEQVKNVTDNTKEHQTDLTVVTEDAQSIPNA